jgi:hypothetical protein
MRKSYGLQPLEQKITSLLKPIFRGSKKEFVIINNLVKNWQDIVGTKYAKFCHPKAINFNKAQKTAKLTIAAYNPSIGFFLDNNTEIILERISSLYGFKNISKIIIKQEPQSVNFDKVEEIILPEKEENFLTKTIAGIEDVELAKTLQKLGRAIFNKD